MNKYKIIFLKILSILVLLAVFVPGKKFDIPYGFILIVTPFERIMENDMSLDLFIHVIGLSGLILIFLKNKIISTLGYFLAIFPLIMMLINSNALKFSWLFWIPVLILIIIITVLLKGKRNMT
ncbi:hypothetical protein ACFPH8_12125 [Bizionia hallyeonensis]|uniref:Uncharacterized protein n=1 Tax=Bizionia hallyeonensis TaxID=1123757 RepID=A0ABW0C8S9_9FLAO